jgi:hypothetical protein
MYNKGVAIVVKILIVKIVMYKSNTIRESPYLFTFKPN